VTVFATPSTASTPPADPHPTPPGDHQPHDAKGVDSTTALRPGQSPMSCGPAVLRELGYCPVAGVVATRGGVGDDVGKVAAGVGDEGSSAGDELECGCRRGVRRPVGRGSASLRSVRRRASTSPGITTMATRRYPRRLVSSTKTGVIHGRQAQAGVGSPPRCATRPMVCNTRYRPWPPFTLAPRRWALRGWHWTETRSVVPR